MFSIFKKLIWCGFILFLPNTLMCNVVRINTSNDFRTRVKEPNTVYEICCVVDLMNATVDVPEKCVLRFVEGRIKNGTIIGNNTSIENNGNLAVFDNISIGEKPFQFINDKIFVDWFCGKDDSDIVQKAIDFAKKNRTPVDFLSRQYTFKRTVRVPIGQCYLRGTGCGGEYQEMGTRIVASEAFSSDIPGSPLFFITGEPKNVQLSKGSVSGRITGISFSSGRKHDVIQFYVSGGPSRPFFIDYCRFNNCGSAIRILDNSSSTAMGFLYIEHCTMTGNRWNVLAHGRHSLLGLYFCKNVAEQCEGNINIGYSDEYTKAPYEKYSPKPLDYSASANIVITDNLLEGTVDCIYINGGKCEVCIERNYFETSRKQFVVLSFSTYDSVVSFKNNYISGGDDVFLRLDNCSFFVQESFPTNCLSLRRATKIKN